MMIIKEASSQWKPYHGCLDRLHEVLPQIFFRLVSLKYRWIWLSFSFTLISIIINYEQIRKMINENINFYYVSTMMMWIYRTRKIWSLHFRKNRHQIHNVKINLVNVRIWQTRKVQWKTSILFVSCVIFYFTWKCVVVFLCSCSDDGEKEEDLQEMHIV